MLRRGKWVRKWTVRAMAADELATAIATARARIHQAFEAEMDAINSRYPPSEREGWQQQLTEARAVIAGSADPTPVLDSIVLASGEDKADLAESILGKARLYAQAYGAALGRKRQKIAQLFQPLALKH
jgi:hypothetical protein